MTNKMLAIIIVAILAVGGTAAGYFYWQNYRPLKDVSLQDDSSSKQPIAPSPEPQNTTAPNASGTPPVAETPKPEILNGCTRMFDANKLQNDKVSIVSRQVEMNVKGFGKITVEFYDKEAPKTVENFLRLTNAGYYDCLTFHRVVKGFVIQGGDPTGTGSGGDSAFGGEFADEVNPSSALYKEGYKKGLLAMANRGPNTNTSQFFITLDDVSLPPAYTIFGKVVSGLDVVEKIGKVEIAPQMDPNDGAPKTPVVMETVKIIK